MQETNEAQPMDYQGYPPTMFKGEKADLLSKIDPTLIVDVIKHNLMGEDFRDGAWIKNLKVINGSLTEFGARDLGVLMLPVSSQNTAISNLNDEEIRTLTLAITDTANEKILANWKEYGILQTDQLIGIQTIIKSNTFITLKQPEKEGIRKLLMGTTSEQRSIIEAEEKKKKWFGLGGYK